MTTYTWTPKNLIHYPLVEHVHLAPDGHQVLFTIRRAYMTDDASEFRNQIFLASTDEIGSITPLTHTEGASQPRWSPDGRYIAFLRKAPGSNNAGLWMMRASGGEAWPLTGETNGVHNAVATFQWSPDGESIAFLCTPWDESQAMRRRRRDDARHWRVDYDYLHLFVVGFSITEGLLPAVRQLTHGRFSIIGLSWSPDNGRIAFTHKETPLLDSWPTTRLATIATDGNDDALVDLGLVGNRDLGPTTPQTEIGLPAR